MKGFFSKLKKNKKGYTLTELIVVVAILGVLAAIGIPSVIGAIDSSRKQADETTMRAIETAVQVCLADGTLTMQKETNNSILVNVIRDKDGKYDLANIRNAVKEKMKGNKYPIHSANKTDVWKLVLQSGEVEQGDITTSGESNFGFIILDAGNLHNPPQAANP